jgi:aryl-alcohol dehydrogenase-like predicted oxidoreductase
MDRVIIPNTELSLCRIGLGTARAGLDWDGEEADRLFGTYLEQGGNLIDTAHVYSDWVKPETARSERVIGDWLSRTGKRRQVVLMTKGGHPDMTAEAPDLHKNRMTKLDMQKDLEGSLRQLKTDCIDIYFYHRDDKSRPVAELIDIMRDFAAQGKIRYFACSNWNAERMSEAGAYCEKYGYSGFVANQALFNIGLRYMKPPADDTIEVVDDNMRAYHEKNPQCLLMPYSGLCGGYFNRLLTKGPGAVLKSEYDSPGNREISKTINTLAEQYCASVSQVLLGFFMTRSFPCIPLFGPRDLPQLTDAMKSLDIPFAQADFSHV